MSESESIPSDIEAEACKAISGLLPEKSKKKYEYTYSKYKEWCTEKNVQHPGNEKVLIAYFSQLSSTYKPSSLWAFYSMIRAMISIEINTDISKYTNLVALLKRKSEGYRCKKSMVLTKTNVTTFLQQADDKTHLLWKVALIIGLAGACRREELTNLLIKHVKDEGTCFHFCLPSTKTKIARDFFVTSGDIAGIDMVKLIRKYINLRPDNVKHGRFFLQYRGGKCMKQPVGINSFGVLPKQIASYLHLEHPETYTGHCFRRSSTSLLADSGADLLTVKRHGGWRSNTVAEGYIENSAENKKIISSKILGETENKGKMKENYQLVSSTATNSSLNEQNFHVLSNISANVGATSGIHLKDCTSCTINIYNK